MPELIGKTLDDYRLIEQIGLGGMATVFKAYQPAMDRYVALKIMSTHLAQDPTFVKRFQQEAKVIARLEHMNILPVYDYGEQEGYLYLVMRFVEGGTIKERVQGGSLPLDETRRIVSQVGSALEYAHQLGVVHRDLKPSNVLIDAQGDCYLTDFGIAKMVESTLGLTGSSVLGTPHYMAPEQSQSGQVDHRADIYAMGIVLYEMVTGQVPFDADTPLAVVMKHITEPLPLPRSIKPDLSEEVERVILKALAKDPANRYQSMRDLVMAFDRAVQVTLVQTSTAATLPSIAQPTVVGEAAAEPTAEVSSVAPLPAQKRWLAEPLPWLLAAGLAFLLLVLGGVILSWGPGPTFIRSEQARIALPPATATPTAMIAATTTPTPVFSPTPTLTQVPPLTPSPTPRSTPTGLPFSSREIRAFAEPILTAIAGRLPDYEDDFSDPGSGWPSGSTAAGDEWGYGEDAYLISASYLPQGACCTGAEPDTALLFSDFVLELDAQFVSGEWGHWGILFRDLGRIAEPPDHYAVGFWPDGHFRVWKNIDGNHITLLETGASPVAFEQGYEMNHLTIIAQGPQIAFYMNSEPVWFLDDDSVMSRGTISLVAENNEADTLLRVRYDNLKVWDISNLPIPSPPEPAELTGVLVKWTYTALGTIWYLDSWGDDQSSGDLNGDGVPDLVFGTAGGDLMAVNGDIGAALWPYRITTQTDAPVNADIMDVDDDGLFEVIGTGKGDSASQGQAIICVLDRDGHQKWQTEGDYDEVTDLAYGDIDGDGDTDIAAAVGTYSWEGGQVILFDGATGSRVWTQSLGSGYAQGLDVRDVDGDGDMELAVENYDNKLFLLDGATGNMLWSRPKSWYGRDVIIADVDDDDTYEIVGVGGEAGAYDPGGKQKWTAETGAEYVSAGDVNGDGQTEVVFSGGFSGELFVVRGSTGETLWSRTRSGVFALGDVNGNGVDDIVAGTIRWWGLEPPYAVEAVDGANNLLWRYPLDSIHNEIGFGLVTVNLDGDPALEVIVANGAQLVALDTSG